MKKFIALLCTLTCILGLTACGSTETVNQYQADKQELTEQLAVESIIPMMDDARNNMSILDIYTANGFTAEDWEKSLSSVYGISVEGEAFTKGLESFITARKEMGELVSIGEVTSSVKDDEILVYVDVTGELKDGQVELIFSNDYTAKLKSCTLNVDATFGDLMTKAALNTLLGMGSVFAVLILIMFIIYAFGLIPKFQKMFSKKEEAPKEAKAPVAAPVVEEVYEEADDYALVAVIAAAIAAYEGQTSTDGFVVRSIKKSRRR